MNIELEQTFKQLAAQFVEKQADLAALEQQRRAAGLRLDDALKRESEAQVALRKVTAALDSANKDLAQAKRDATKIRSDAAAERDRILAQAHDQASGYLQAVQSAITAAASTLKRKEKTNA
jgi:hypothetical protein